MKKSEFLAEVHRIRYVLRGVNLQLAHQCRPDGTVLIIIWQDAKLKKHEEVIGNSSIAKFMDDKANCLRWLNN